MLRLILIAAGTVVVAVTWNTTSAAHDPEHVRNITCAIAALPFLLPALWLECRVRKAATAPAAPATRPVSTFGPRR